MITCPQCAALAFDNATLCPVCGVHISQDEAEAVMVSASGEHVTGPVSQADSERSSEDSAYHIALDIGDELIPLHLSPGDMLILGRGGPAENVDLDLSGYGGLEAGVSRHHFALRLEDDLLQGCDLGSSNGSYLNSCWLPARDWYDVHDGDLLQVGSLFIIFRVRD